jgi:hypothetical protein
MSFFFRNSDPASLTEATSTLIHRPGPDVIGLREVIDELTGLTVIALPMTMVREIVPARAMMTAAYVLAGPGRIYCGESTRIGRRIWDHAGDASKSFAREVFIITRSGMESLDMGVAIYLQAHLTRRAEEAGFVTVQRGTGPQVLEPTPARGAFYARIANIAERLLFDAGCTAFHAVGNVSCEPGPCEPSAATVPAASPEAGPETADEDTPIEIGVAATPGDATEYQLAYGDIWARGYEADGGFVVTAGSEVRREVNASVNPILHTRRRELAAAGVLADIGGRDEPQRLLVAVWFPSRAIAAKTVTGAHVGGNKWMAVANPRPFVLAA